MMRSTGARSTSSPAWFMRTPSSKTRPLTRRPSLGRQSGGCHRPITHRLPSRSPSMS
jgi:hypothetical protein